MCRRSSFQLTLWWCLLYLVHACLPASLTDGGRKPRDRNATSKFCVLSMLRARLLLVFGGWKKQNASSASLIMLLSLLIVVVNSCCAEISVDGKVDVHVDKILMRPTNQASNQPRCRQKKSTTQCASTTQLGGNQAQRTVARCRT